jgi:lipid A 3-O-deacylase
MRTGGSSICLCFWFLAVATARALPAAEATVQEPSAATFSTPSPAGDGIWQDGIGGGFRSTTESFNLSAGASSGVTLLGGRVRHDLALISLSYGHMLGSVVGQNHWYRGNLELRGELFAGSEFSPGQRGLVGLTPHLRYNFATGTHWIPFADVGAGVTATGERAPDLGGAFEFNLQGGAGVHWFIRDHLALTVEARLLHISSAGIYRPNLGLNTIAGMAGVTWFF